jgi:50S ribosomal protein L16 3-hydroxylase
MINISLSTLFSPLSHFDFFESYLKDEPIAAHGVKGLEELTSLPLLESLESLLKEWPSLVNAYLEGTADEVNSHAVSTDEASKLFINQGRGLFFDDPNRFSPLIEKCLQELKQDLGLSNLTYARSLIYAIAKGKGTAAHFDQNINFVLQVSGTKKWWIAPNTSVRNPTERHTLGHPIAPELASYMDGEFPKEFPENAKEYILKPGSVLFLPRGTWHKTLAETDALSLNFTYSAPTWIDLMTAALRGRLTQSSEWRETANFVNDPELHVHANEKFDRLISELAQDAQTWRAQDILGATEN